MKKIKLTFVLTVLMSMVGLRAFAHDIEDQYQGKTIYYKWINNNTELQVTYRGSSRFEYTNWYGGDIRIPESVTYNSQTYNVTSIASYAFYNCNVDRVFLPDNVTEIQDWAFYGSKISTFYGSANLTKIGKGVFYDCPYLSGDISLPNKVTEIGGSIANGNVGFYIGGSGSSKYVSYYNYAIYERDSHKLVSACGLFPSSMPSYFTGVGAYAFHGVSLTSLTIPSNVTNIDSYAFAGCRINSIILPTGLTSIGDNVFYDSNVLTSVEIPNSVTSIGSCAFYSCDNLTSVTIPNSVTTIGSQAFYGCDLTSVTIPNSVTSIGSQAFYGSGNSLTEVTIEKKTPISISASTFRNRTNATLYVPLGCKEAYEAANIWKDFKEIIEMNKDMSSPDITINPISAVTYNGSAQTPTITVKDGTTTLTSGTHYTVAYSNNINAGTATVTITGQGNYTGTKSANFTINPKNASNLTINAISAVTYNGSAQTPAVTVRDGSTTLTNGTHYTVAYSNNTNAGTATVTITGMGNYTSTKNANFTINKAPLTITAKSYTITEGDPLPSFECTYSGFQNGETESVLTTLPTITCDATDSETAGEYDITPSGAAATNYSFNYVSGTLTVNAAESVTIAMKTGGGVARSMIAYSSKYALDFTSRPELKAYIACGYNDKKEVLLVHVKVVPPYTGMVIKTSNGIYDGGEYDVPTTTEEYYYANLLVPVVETGTVTPTETIADVEYTNLTIGTLVGGGIGFVRLTSNWTTHNKSYLRIPTALYNSLASARGFGDIGVEFVEGEEATGILNAKRNALENNGNYYDLLGRKVKPIGKGLYIHNGKKVLVK